MSARRAGQGGFTIIEVMTVVAIVAFLAAVAIPSLTQTIKNSKLRGTASDMFGDLLTARSEAVKRNCPVDVIPLTAGDWSTGWKVVPENTCTSGGGTIVAQHVALDSDIKVNVMVNTNPSTAATITYGSNGRISAGQPQTVVFYELVTGVFARCLDVDTSGVPRISVDTKGAANACS